MFDWLFKTSEKDEIRRIGKKICDLEIKLNREYALMRRRGHTCLYDDQKRVAPLKQRIAELYEKRDKLRLNQYHKAIDELNKFPLHTPCTLRHISNILDIDYDSLHRAMYVHRPTACYYRLTEHCCNIYGYATENVLKLDNWREIRYKGVTYLERIK